MKPSILRSVVMFSTFATISAACASGPVLKAGAHNPVALERELQRQLDKYVSYPLMARAGSMDGAVMVSFVIDTQGQVNVIGAESTSDELRDYVLGKLAKVDIGSNPDGLWKTTHMKFVFRPEA